MLSLLRLTTLAALLPVSAQATTLLWPITSGGGACASTLQACINAAGEGDTIVIGADEFIGADRYTLINESLTITRSLSLVAQPGIDAVFASGRNINAMLSGAARSVTFSGLTLQRGTLRVDLNGAGSGSSVNLNRVRVQQMPDVFTAGCAIEVQAYGGSVQPAISIGDNVIGASSTAGDSGGGICVSSDASIGEMTVAVFRNRIIGAAGRIVRGIGISGPAAGSTSVSANQVLGPRMALGISVQRGGSGAHQLRADNNVVTLQDEGGVDAFYIEADSNVTVINNTVAYSRNGMRVIPFANGISGRFANNLIAQISGSALQMSPTNSTITNSHNLLHAVGSTNWTPGPNTLSGDPLLESQGYPRPQPGSPAITAGNNADLPPLVLFDADGERRIALGTVDIGAFEVNVDDAGQLTADASNSFFNEVRINHLRLQLIAADRLQVTPIHTSLPQVAQNLGVYLNGLSPGSWSVFHQDSTVNVAFGQRFNVMLPVTGKTSIDHATTAASVSGNQSRIEDPELNARSYMIAAATHRWTGTYHDHAIGMAYSTAGGGRWFLRNENSATPMPEGLNFNIVVAPLGSPNAFRTTLTQSVFEWRLEHPLLDDNPCAPAIVGRVDDPDVSGVLANPAAYALDYRAPSGAGAPGRWYIVAEASGAPTPDGAPAPSFPQNAAFSVIIEGQQSNRCRAPVPDRMFANGYE